MWVDRSPDAMEESTPGGAPDSSVPMRYPLERGRPRMATTLSNVRTIGVPVSDQDAAVAFFFDALGFAPGMDAELQPGFRWIEVAPPGSPVSVALVAASDAYPSGVDTGI